MTVYETEALKLNGKILEFCRQRYDIGVLLQVFCYRRVLILLLAFIYRKSRNSDHLGSLYASWYSRMFHLKRSIFGISLLGESQSPQKYSSNDIFKGGPTFQNQLGSSFKGD